MKNDEKNVKHLLAAAQNLNEMMVEVIIGPEALKYIKLTERYWRLRPYLSRKGRKALRRKWGL
jgi:hypothetical protein